MIPETHELASMDVEFHYLTKDDNSPDTGDSFEDQDLEENFDLAD